MRLVYPLIILLLCSLAQAETRSQGSERFGDYEIHYSIFPSTFVQPETARAAGLKRSKYESLINISVTPTGKYGGLPVELEGTVTNLLQQQKALKFIAIKEPTAVYYLAPVRVSGEETVHFKIQASTADKQTLQLNFSTTLYADK